MRTTTQDIEAIISGQPVEIDLPFPLGEQPLGGWHINQPTDWLDDMASGVFDAALAQAKAEPTIAGVAALPPTDGWIRRQAEALQATKERIAELAAIETRSPEDDLELENLQVHQSLLFTPDNFTRADELAYEIASNAMDAWLLPRLIVDCKGKLVFDQSNATGSNRWRMMGKDNRKALVPYLRYVRNLVKKAKNYKPGQSSS